MFMFKGLHLLQMCCCFYKFRNYFLLTHLLISDNTFYYLSIIIFM